MLQKIIEYLRSKSKPVDFDELARVLGVERSALSGMLETLLRQKRIVLEDDLCCDCALHKVDCGHCPVRSFAENSYKRYSIPQHTYILPRN